VAILPMATEMNRERDLTGSNGWPAPHFLVQE